MENVEEVLKKLVECNTIKDKENQKIMNYIEKTLQKYGFETEKREKFLIMKNKKACDLGFVGHTDTVEYTNNWSYEKFTTTKNNNKIYGLGVCDMKSGIAGIISAISQTNFEKLNSGIKLYFTYDEEIGFSGIKDVVNYEKNFPENLIIGEPTNNEIMVGSKGLMEYEICFTGVKVHSSTPEKGKNAIMSAMNFINELSQFYEKIILSNTTMNIGKIEGGSAINSVPDFCKVLIDFRTANIEDETKIENKMLELAEKYSAKMKILNKLSAFCCDNFLCNNSLFNNLLCNNALYNNSVCNNLLLKNNKANQEDKRTQITNFITEASFLKNNRIILGAGSITAHEVNENISVDSLYMLVEQYKEIIQKFCN